jgi:peptidoglycan/xylan/chitin deacetylase (PgdA/CDA1 family)
MIQTPAVRTAGDKPMAPKHDAVVITYHRLPDKKLAKAKFHDLPFGRFREQMELVAKRVHSNLTTPNVCIAFHDGTKDHLAAGKLLSELGLKGTFFIVTGWLGQKGFLTRDDVKELARLGHRIGSHTVTHPNLTKLNQDELNKELVESKRTLEDITNQSIDWLAPPGGMYNRSVLERADAQGYFVFSTMEWGYADWPLKGRVSCFPVLALSHPDTFQRILDGKASVWPYVAKNYIKKVIGEDIYSNVRNRSSRLLRKIIKLY